MHLTRFVKLNLAFVETRHALSLLVKWGKL